MRDDISLCDQLRWKGPFAVDAALHAQCSGAIVYRVRAFDPSGRARVIHRAGGDDISGTLDIGESGDGSDRMYTLMRVLNGNSGSHRAAWEYRWYDFHITFPVAELRLDIIEVGEKKLAEAIECALLEEYRTEFLDRPPLNGTSGKPAAVERWLRSQGAEPRDSDGWLRLESVMPHHLVRRPKPARSTRSAQP
ncbi:MAG: hypothetical protein AB7T06_10760 [Kofleriaceae bacterium]